MVVYSLVIVAGDKTAIPRAWQDRLEDHFASPACKFDRTDGLSSLGWSD
jgi:hypothetical protein